MAISKPNQSGQSSNKILLQNRSGLKYLKWGGVANKPNFSIELEIPYRTPIVQTNRAQPSVNFSESTEVIGFNSSGTTDFYVKNGTQEISSFRPSTNQMLARFRLRTGDRIAHINNRFPSVIIDSRVEFLADGKFTLDGRQQMLVGTPTQLILLQLTAAGLRVVAAQTRPEFWSGNNRWNRDSQARHPVQVGDFNADGTMDILLTNDSGLRIISVDRRNNRFNEIGRLNYGTDIRGRAFSESQHVLFFGKYASFNNKDAILIHDDDHMRVVYLTGRDRAGVFAEILGSSRRGLARILDNDQVSIGSPRHSRPSWLYDPNRDKPVFIGDFTGDGLNEIVLERRSRSDQKLQRLGILRLGASVPRGLHLKDFNVTDCYGHEACHGGHFGHWLLRNTDSVYGTAWDNTHRRAMLMIMNNPE